MEDLVEEIVGEIHDDLETDTDKIIEERKGVYVVPGSIELSALEEKLGVPLVANTDCTTVAGAVVELFGRLPSPGEKIEHGGLEIEVLDADRRRVQRLRLKTLAPKANE
jgi:CBS domain containing-hemolysin-like protein